jgi:hypothetical protein
MTRPPTEWKKSLQVTGGLILIGAPEAAVAASMVRHHRIGFVPAEPSEDDVIEPADGELDERSE